MGACYACCGCGRCMKWVREIEGLCPKCKEPVELGQTVCPSCGSFLPLPPGTLDTRHVSFESKGHVARE